MGAPAGGIWKSTDGGLKWDPLTDYLPQIGVSGIAVHPTDPLTIYIATGDDDAGDSYAVGVWKTTDGGETWNNTGDLSGNPNSMNDIFIHPTNHNTVLIATSSGVHKSTNGGDTWARKQTGNIRDLKMKPNDPTIWYAATNSAFYKSSNGGESFVQKTVSGLSSSSRLVMDVTPANDNYIYMVSAGSGSSFNGVYKSTDAGETFNKTTETDNIFESTQAWYDLALTVSDSDANKIYVGVLNIWSSTDGGDNFTKLNNWSSPNTASYTHADIHILRFINGKFFAGTDGGIYVSTDHGTNFTDLTENLAISQFYKISVAQQNSGNIVGGLQDNGGYAFSNNNWNNYHGADGMDAAVSGVDADTYYGFIQYGGSLYITNNGGLSTSSSVGAPGAETSAGDSGGEWVTPLVSDKAGNIYAGYKELYKLVDGAWAKISDYSFSDDLDHIEIDPNNNSNIYVAQSNILYKSIDAGVTFVSIGSFSGAVNSVEINNNDSNIAYITTSSAVLKSTNVLSSSPTFNDISSNLPSESKLVARHHARSGKNTIYLGTALGVYFLNDDSTDWEVFDNNLPNVAVRDLEINEEDSKLFAATYGRGVFSTDIPRVLPPTDVRLIAINNPTNSINCSDQISPEIVVLNQGTNNITTLAIKSTIERTNTTYNWTGNISPGEQKTITIPVISVPIGSQTIKIEATTTDDAYDTNNKKESSFIVNNFSANPTITNTFEDSGDNLIVEVDGADSNTWALGEPSGTLLSAASSGTKAYATNLSGNYPNLTTQYLYTRCLNLAGLSSPILSFKMAFDIEQDWDYLVVEYTTNSGNNWTILGNASDDNWYNSSSIANGIPGSQWTGEGEDTNPLGDTNATFHDYSYDLAALASETNIVFRFKMFSDQEVNEEGVIIDDLVINGTVLNLNNETLQQSFSVFPNPSNEIFNLSWLENGEASVTVYDYTGKLIMKKENIKENSYELNLNGFSKGLYLTKISINGKQATKKLILE